MISQLFLLKILRASVTSELVFDVPEGLPELAMEEHEHFVRDVVFGNGGGLIELLTSSQTMIEAELAAIYGVAGASGEVPTAMVAGNTAEHVIDDGLDLVGQGAAVGVAEHDPAGTAVVGGLHTGERIVAVRLVAVEEVLGVVHGLFTGVDGGLDGITDHGEVFVVGNLERDIDLVGPGLADEAGALSWRIQDRRDDRIVGGRAARASGHAEGNEARALEPRIGGEELSIGRVGARPAALDIINAQLIQRGGNPALISNGKVHALCLRTIPQGSVEQEDAL